MNNIGSVFTRYIQFRLKWTQEIGLITSHGEAIKFRLREIGFKKILKYLKIPINDQFIFSVYPTFNGAYNDMLKLLNPGKKLPTAFFAINDITAYGCIKATKEKGYKVPDDISIIGFDNLPLGALTKPALTTIRVSKRRIGKMSIQILNERIKSQKIFSLIKITINGNSIVKSSVNPLLYFNFSEHTLKQLLGS